MSDQGRDYVWTHSPFTGTKKLIHLALGDVANDLHDHRLWMRQSTLAAKVGCTRQTVNETLAVLVDDGYLEVVNESPGKPCEYIFLFKGVSANPTGGVGKSDRSEGASPLVVNNQRDTTTSKSRRGYRLMDYTPEEEAVWSAYPKRNGGNPKRTAIEGYRRWLTAGIPHATLLAAAKTYAAQAPDPDYVLMAQTFFGPGERWRDFLPATSPVAEATRVEPLTADEYNAARAYEQWDELETWQDGGEWHTMHPQMNGLRRPRRNGFFVDIDAKLYELHDGKRIYVELSAP